MFFRAATNSGTASPHIPNHREAWSLRVGSSTGPLASGPVSMWHCILGVLKCLKHSLPIESLECFRLEMQRTIFEHLCVSITQSKKKT